MDFIREKMTLVARPFCPISPERHCYGPQCAWWLERTNRCAVVEIARKIGARQKGAGRVQKEEAL